MKRQQRVRTSKVCPAGLHHTRLSEDNPEELAFRLAWQCMNLGPAYGSSTANDLLAHLLDTKRVPPRTIGFGFANTPITERDRVVAATVIQWLGSNVGRAFIDEARARVQPRKGE